MSKIIFRFSFLISIIFLLTITNLRHSEAMFPNDTGVDISDNLTVGQRIVKEAKNAPNYEPKNYGRNTRKSFKPPTINNPPQQSPQLPPKVSTPHYLSPPRGTPVPLPGNQTPIEDKDSLALKSKAKIDNKKTKEDIEKDAEEITNTTKGLSKKGIINLLLKGVTRAEIEKIVNSGDVSDIILQTLVVPHNTEVPSLIELCTSSPQKNTIISQICNNKTIIEIYKNKNFIPEKKKLIEENKLSYLSVREKINTEKEEKLKQTINFITNANLTSIQLNEDEASKLITHDNAEEKAKGAVLYKELAVRYQALGDIEKAIECYEKASAYDLEALKQLEFLRIIKDKEDEKVAALENQKSYFLTVTSIGAGAILTIIGTIYTCSKGQVPPPGDIFDFPF